MAPFRSQGNGLIRWLTVCHIPLSVQVYLCSDRLGLSLILWKHYRNNNWSDTCLLSNPRLSQESSHKCKSLETVYDVPNSDILYIIAFMVSIRQVPMTLILLSLLSCQKLGKWGPRLKLPELSFIASYRLSVSLFGRLFFSTCSTSGRVLAADVQPAVHIYYPWHRGDYLPKYLRLAITCLLFPLEKVQFSVHCTVWYCDHFWDSHVCEVFECL